MKQEERVLAWLADGQWHCAREALNDYLYTFSQRVSEINAKERGRIATRPCQDHDHRIYQYQDTYAARPQQLELAG